nr:response regulator transcription factor [Sedimenticola hydrogenitrophicus]
MAKNDLIPPTGQTRILIVDDHPLVRAGFRALIGDEPDLAVCGEASGFTEAMRLATDQHPDVVIVDLSLAEGSGLELVKHLHMRLPDVRLLVCSMHDESLFAERALKAGARGYINKQEATDHVVEAVHQVLRGEIYLSDAMTQRVLQAEGGVQLGSVEALTDRELEVFSLIGQGIGTSRIAEQLHLSVKTVESHREKIKKKLKLLSATELSRYATQWSLERN